MELRKEGEEEEEQERIDSGKKGGRKQLNEVEKFKQE